MPSDESKGSQLDAIGSLAQRQLDNTLRAPKLVIQRRPQGADESAGEVAGVPVAAMYRAQARQLAPTLPGARTP